MYCTYGEKYTEICCKQRYESLCKEFKDNLYISSKLGDISLPMSLAEESEDLQTDEKYINAMRFLRTYANSNRDKLPRVSQDLSI